MQRLLYALGIVLLTMSQAYAQTPSPTYSHDPFDDADFNKAPLIHEVAHPSKRHFEIGLLYTTSIIDKYTYHNGATLDLTYFIYDTLGVSLNLAYLGGGLTSIVTDPQGVIGNKLATCGVGCTDINPTLPDYYQVTGIADALLVWAPLYGKINLVSELALNMQIYGLVGLGINGTRQILAEKAPTASGYRLVGNGAFDGGMFSDPKGHLTIGAGLKFYLYKGLALRTELRALGFRDKFEFEPGAGLQGYTTLFWFGQAGLSYVF